MSKVVPIEDLGPSVVTHVTCLLVPYERNRSKFLAAVRAALACGKNIDLVVIVPRRRPILRWRLTRRKDDRLHVVPSPEPTRHGLSLGRSARFWERVITGSSLDLTTPSAVNALLDLADSSPDAGLIGTSTISSVSGLVTRISSDLLILNRSALNLASGLDESMITLQDMADELAGRFTRAGIPLVALGPTVSPAERVGDVAQQRYPWLSGSDRSESSQGSRSGAQSQRTAVAQPRKAHDLLLDLSAVRMADNGTGQHALRTLRALTRFTDVQLTALLGTSTDQQVLQECEQLGIESIHLEAPGGRGFEAALRPYQFETVSEVDQLRSVANRIIVSHLDFIAADNPTYHPDSTLWLRHRSEVLSALAAVDGVAWLSRTVRERAIANGFDASSVPNRVCGSVVEIDGAATPPGQPPVSGPYIATLGASYHHKGRLYAIRLFERLVGSGWQGRMVLAGWDPPHGSSRSEEDALIDSSPALRDRVVLLGALSPSDQIAAIAGATVLVQPSVSEGFGLLPAEAATYGVPTVMLHRSSLREIYPPDYRGWMTGDDLERDAHVLLNLVTASSDSRKELAGHLLGVGNQDRYAADLIELLQEVATR